MDIPNLPQVLVVSRGLIFFQNKYLFLRREKSDSYAPDKWELPGGKLDKGETLEENLLRESTEETGLNLVIVKADISVASEKVTNGKYNGYLAVTVFGLLKSLTPSPKISPEHSEFLWLELKDAAMLDLTNSTRTFMDNLMSDGYLIALLKEVNTLSRPSK